MRGNGQPSGGEEGSSVERGRGNSLEERGGQ